MRFIRVSYFIGLFILTIVNARASERVVLTDQQEEYILSGNTIDIFEDKSKTLTVEQVARLANESFLWNEVKGTNVNNPKSAYWIKFTYKDISQGKYNWLLEFYDNRLDDISVYFPNGKGGYTVQMSGDLKPFSDKSIQHINFVFAIPNNLNPDSNTVFVRLYSDHQIYVFGLIRSVQRFVQYTTFEYFFVTIFYGILLAMIVYNFIIMLSVRERSYVYYVMYMFCAGLYSFSRDGFGFQFVWPNHPEFNLFIEPLALYGITVTLLLYAREFLNTNELTPVFDKFIVWVVIIRTVVLVIGVCLSHSFIRNLYFDIPLILLAYIAGFWAYKKGDKAARFYIAGFTALFIGFTIIIIDQLNFEVSDVFAFYSFNLGVLIQLLVLSFALMDRVKIIIKEKEHMKDQLNMQLEVMVKERTVELLEKNEQLDSFVYKASHDLKGPLRSIMGLTSVGLTDFKDSPYVTTYFNHILKTATKLDMVLEDLLMVTKIKNTKVQVSYVLFEVMVQEIMQTFSNLNGFERVKLKLNIEGSLPLVSDEKVLYSIIQNLIENAIKYQDFAKPEALLTITLLTEKEMATIIVEDNGEGMEASQLNHIFEMFYKVNDRSIGSGLGLFILKQAVQRLQGKISVTSVFGEGSKFTIVLPQ